MSENVGGVLSSESSVPVPDASFDGITLFFVAHEVDELPHFLKEMYRILRPKGQLIVVDFDPDSSVGPPANHRLAVDTLVNALENPGFPPLMNGPMNLNRRRMAASLLLSYSKPSEIKKLPLGTN